MPRAESSGAAVSDDQTFAIGFPIAVAIYVLYIYAWEKYDKKYGVGKFHEGLLIVATMLFAISCSLLIIGIWVLCVLKSFGVVHS